MKHVLITGATGNLGSAVTKKLTGEGFHVIAASHSDPPSEFEGNDRITAVKVDLTDPDAVSKFVSSLNEPIDAAILTVGGFAMGGFSETGVEDIRKMIRLNFETAYHLVRQLLPKMTEHDLGQIILIGARPALDPKAGHKMVAYALSKQLIFSLSEMINAAASGTQVHATVIVPSTIDTPQNRESMPDADPGKWVKPEQIADTVAFLLGESGQVLREPLIRIYHRS